MQTRGSWVGPGVDLGPPPRPQILRPKFLLPCLAAIFFMTIFYRPRGDIAPLPPSPDPLLIIARNTSNIATLLYQYT